MSLIKKLAGETVLYGMSSIVGRLLNYLLVPLYTRMLSKAEYGIVSEFYSYTGFLLVLYTYRMETAFFRYGTEAKDRDEAFSSSMLAMFGSTALFSGVIMLFAQPIANFLQYPRHPEYISYFALILAFDALSELPFARLRLEQRPLRFVFAKMLNICINVGLCLFWLVFCPWAYKNGYTWVDPVWDPGKGVGYIFQANLMAGGVTLLVLFPQFLAAFKTRFDYAFWVKMLRYAGPLVVVSFAGIANEMLDRTLMTRILPGTLEENRAELGVYAANYKLAMLVSLFTQAYRYAAEPFFFRHAKDENSLKIQADTTKWFTIAASLGMLGVLLYLDIIKHFLGKDFHEGVDIVPILLLANVFLGVYYNFSVWYRLKDKTNIGAWISVTGAVVTLLLNLWWVPTLGYRGAAWATLVCYALMAWLTWFVGRKYHPVEYPLWRMAAYTAGALVLYFISEGVKIWLGAGYALWGINTVLFAGYIYAIYRFEWKKL